MTVDVIEAQTRVTEFGELGVDFRAQLFSQTSAKEIARANNGGIIAKLPATVEQTGYRLPWQGGASTKQAEMKAHAKPPILPGQLHRLLAPPFVEHHARA